MGAPNTIDRVPRPLQAILAGVCLVGSIPPWGFWPLAFVGIALFDGLMAAASPKQRFASAWLMTAVWLYAGMLWMWDLTAPGYLLTGVFYGLYYAAAAALTPQDFALRRIVLPGSFVLAEAARWYWPFGGVPLANLALGQTETLLAGTARIGGPLLIIGLIIVGGQALAALLAKRWTAAAVGLAVMAAAMLAGGAYPRATVVDTIEAGLVQGGGPNQTRASSDQNPVVLARHAEATRYLDKPVDLILWPENVVNPGRYLTQEESAETVTDVAQHHNATVLAGWFYRVDDKYTVNYQTAVTPEGEEIARYDKVRTVPFGEYVPLRGLIESIGFGLADLLPPLDARPGTEPPVLDTPVGPVGVSISWEAYFSRRTRDAADSGAQLMTNPTNASSFWLTQVQTQQVASNQLRAIESDRWLLMAAPTGLSAVINPDGTVLQRTDMGERKILTSKVEMRTGTTLFTRVGHAPVLAYAGAAAIFGLFTVLAGRAKA